MRGQLERKRAVIQNTILIIGQFPIFAGLSGAHLEKIGNILKRKRYKAGQIIIQEGETGDSMFLLLDGGVEVSKTLTLKIDRASVDTRDKSLVRLSAEDMPCFGEMALLGNSHKRTATIKSSTDCTVGIISRQDCLKLCEEDALLGYLLMKNVAKAIALRLERANRDVIKLTTAFSLALQ